MNPILYILCAALLTGCVSTYERSSITRTASPLSTNATALVTTPPDGSFERENYPGTGKQTAIAVAQALGRYLKRVEVADEGLTREAALQRAKAGTFDYLVMPEIVHWENRATEWSGKPDRITISVRTIRAADGSLLDHGQFSGKSKWFTFGGDAPEDLLYRPCGEHIAELFGQPKPKSPAPSPSQFNSRTGR